MQNDLKIAVIGATGLVGREILAALAERKHSAGKITAFASERSEGLEVDYGDDTLEVEKVTEEAFRGIGLAIFATPPEASRALIPWARRAGVSVIDLSSAFRSDPACVLVAPTVRRLGDQTPAVSGKWVRCPSVGAMVSATLLNPLDAQYGLVAIEMVGLISASSAGVRGVSELQQQTASLLSANELDEGRFPHRLAFNVIPQVGTVSEVAGWTSEEALWKNDWETLWVSELKPKLMFSALQIPTFHGHLFQITFQLRQSAAIEQIREYFKKIPSVKVLDSLGEKIYPMPMLIAADSSIHVGRIRANPAFENSFSLTAVIDNVVRGAALNALETADLMFR